MAKLRQRVHHLWDTACSLCPGSSCPIPGTRRDASLQPLLYKDHLAAFWFHGGRDHVSSIPAKTGSAGTGWALRFQGCAPFLCTFRGPGRAPEPLLRGRCIKSPCSCLQPGMSLAWPSRHPPTALTAVAALVTEHGLTVSHRGAEVAERCSCPGLGARSVLRGPAVGSASHQRPPSGAGEAGWRWLSTPSPTHIGVYSYCIILMLREFLF